MAIKIEGKGRVWAKEHEGWTSYTIGISNKNQDGTWINAYQQVRFRKNVKVPNGTDIELIIAVDFMAVALPVQGE